MERTEIFNEYARILNEAEDLVNGGYRREHEIDIVVPPLRGKSPEMSQSDGAAGRIRPETAEKNSLPTADSRPLQSGGGSTTGRGGAVQHRIEESGSLRQIANEIAECRNCNLYLTRNHTVPGTGSQAVTLMIVSPPPADSAASRDSPLAVHEQEYLNKWLTALGLNPETDIFITPAVKCRTPAGRPPHPAELQACSAFLRRQYKEVRPRAVLALGETACGALTGNPSDFPSLVGQDWNWGAVPALVLWTPAEVLAGPGRLRGPVWIALQQLRTAWNAIPGSSV
jgi:DNA polymerase